MDRVIILIQIGRLSLGAVLKWNFSKLEVLNILEFILMFLKSFMQNYEDRIPVIYCKNNMVVTLFSRWHMN